MNALRVDIKLMTKELAQPRGVEERSGSENLIFVLWVSLDRKVRKNIHWIGHNKNNDVWILFENAREDAIEDGGIFLDEFESRLSGFLRGSAGTSIAISLEARSFSVPAFTEVCPRTAWSAQDP